MAVHDWKKVRKGRLTPKQLAKVDADVREELALLSLRDLRREAGLTQDDLSEVLDISQSELSKAERRNDHLISTVRRYVEGLGGELEIYARLGDVVVKLRV